MRAKPLLNPASDSMLTAATYRNKLGLFMNLYYY